MHENQEAFNYRGSAARFLGVRKKSNHGALFTEWLGDHRFPYI
jgi:hypothetical protein